MAHYYSGLLYGARYKEETADGVSISLKAASGAVHYVDSGKVSQNE